MTIPTCHHCGSDALPFAVTLAGGQWPHSCGAIVCPACGSKPQQGDHLCSLCRQLTQAPRQTGSIDLGAADIVRGGALSAVPRGRPRDGRR